MHQIDKIYLAEAHVVKYTKNFAVYEGTTLYATKCKTKSKSLSYILWLEIYLIQIKYSKLYKIYLIEHSTMPAKLINVFLGL